MWKNTVVPNGRHVAAWHMHVECLLPQAMNTLTTYNTYCFSTAVVVTWVHLSDRLHIHPLFCLHFVLNIGFRTILHQSLFDIGKVSGFIPDVTRCGGLNNCVCLCVCICVCVCVCAWAHVCVYVTHFWYQNVLVWNYLLYIMCPVLYMHPNCKKFII